VFPLNNERPLALASFFDTSEYPEETSDIVALLVIEHQMAMQNSLTRAGQRTRKMIEYQRSLQKTLKDPVTDEPTYDSVKRVFASAVEDVVDHLLFRGAAPIPAGVVGAETFKRAFADGVPRNQGGHSLKDLSLDGRVFANRCSYLIYSESFNLLPPQLKTRVLDRLRVALMDEDPDGRYAYLEEAEKKRIFDILLETHTDANFAWADARSTESVLRR
jgi:hypothetical protein